MVIESGGHVDETLVLLRYSRTPSPHLSDSCTNDAIFYLLLSHYIYTVIILHCQLKFRVLIVTIH